MPPKPKGLIEVTRGQNYKSPVLTIRIFEKGSANVGTNTTPLALDELYQRLREICHEHGISQHANELVTAVDETWDLLNLPTPQHRFVIHTLNPTKLRALAALSTLDLSARASVPIQKK